MKSLEFFLKEVFINGFVTVKDDDITEAPAQDGSDKETGQEPRYIVA
jgi:hypothetical protein